MAGLWAGVFVAALAPSGKVLAGEPSRPGDVTVAGEDFEQPTAPSAGTLEDAASEPTSLPLEDAGAAAPPLFTSTVNGYFDSRFNYTQMDTTGLIDTSMLPSWSNLTEANVQLKLRWGERAFLASDASFFYQRGWGFQMGSTQGRLPLADRDVPGYRPLALVNEFYGSLNFGEHINLTLGKKRIVWGPGLAINPTDLLNPPKDPTDPTFQRAGAWLLRAEFPFDWYTFTFVGAAKVLSQYGGVPSALLTYPPYPSYENVLAPAAFSDARDRDAHFAAVARLYALVSNTDLNAYYVLTNLYNDGFRHKSRVGISASRFVWGALEVHGELLVQQGSARSYVNRSCLDDLTTRRVCGQAGTLVSSSALDSGTWAVRSLLGGSYAFADETLLSLEYYFAGDGYTDPEFQNYVQVLQLAQMAQRQGFVVRLPSTQPADPGSPQKFSFDSLRRHYVFITAMRPHLFDDWTVNAVLLLGAQDLSGVFVPSVTWSAQEWVNLSLFAFVVIPGPPGLRLSAGGQKVSEFELLPMDWRVMISARMFY